MLFAKATYIYFFFKKKHKQRKKNMNKMMPAFWKMALLLEEK